jgi:hypothetical protein
VGAGDGFELSLCFAKHFASFFAIEKGRMKKRLPARQKSFIQIFQNYVPT